MTEPSDSAKAGAIPPLHPSEIGAARTELGAAQTADLPDDLSRDVYCILGLPFDAVDVPGALGRIFAAVSNRAPFLISTPNLNFLVNGLTDPAFRESLLLSNMCLPDGMPIVWIARLLRIPFGTRVAGSDILEALKTNNRPGLPLRIFLFGATEEVAAAAAQTLSADGLSTRCVGYLCPGFGTVDDMSSEQIISKVNDSKADFLSVSLGATKGQHWLLQNHDRLRIPVRVHLGAAINFQAGIIKRAPKLLRRIGCEWLWRIGQEPKLWRRYWNDGLVLLRLLVTQILPLAREVRRRRKSHNLVIDQANNADGLTLRLAGEATADQVGKIIPLVRNALTSGEALRIDMSMVEGIDARFLGLLLILRKRMDSAGLILELIGLSPNMIKIFRLHGVEYLVEARTKS